METVAAGVDVRTLRDPVDPSGVLAETASIDVSTLVLQTGLPPDQAGVVIPWAGTVPSKDGVPTAARLTTVTLPSSAVLLSATWWRTNADDGSAAGGGCGNDWSTTVLPGGEDVVERTFAFRCTTHDLTGTADSQLTSLVVVAPLGSTSVRLYDELGAPLEELALVDGTVVTAEDALVSRTASVMALRADGTPSARADLLTGQ
jgi:hypothetical protein